MMPPNKDAIHTAEKRMQAKLLAFDIAFSKYTKGISSGSSLKTTSGTSAGASPQKALGNS